MCLNMVWLILLIAVLSYREVLHLIQRGSWYDWDYYNIFWFTDNNSKWKDWDSFHFANGLATLIIIILIKDYLYMPVDISSWFYVPVYWLLWMHVRNCFLHIIFKREPEWKYLLPQIIYKLWRRYA